MQEHELSMLETLGSTPHTTRLELKPIGNRREPVLFWMTLRGNRKSGPMGRWEWEASAGCHWWFWGCQIESLRKGTLEPLQDSRLDFQGCSIEVGGESLFKKMLNYSEGEKKPASQVINLKIVRWIIFNESWCLASREPERAFRLSLIDRYIWQAMHPGNLLSNN